MSVQAVTMWRVVCDCPDCKASAQDDSDYWAWAQQDEAVVEAQDADWYVSQSESRHLCRTHRPSCAEPGCDLALHDDEFGDRCEDHAQVTS